MRNSLITSLLIIIMLILIGLLINYCSKIEDATPPTIDEAVNLYCTKCLSKTHTSTKPEDCTLSLSLMQNNHPLCSDKLITALKCVSATGSCDFDLSSTVQASADTFLLNSTAYLTTLIGGIVYYGMTATQSVVNTSNTIISSSNDYPIWLFNSEYFVSNFPSTYSVLKQMNPSSSIADVATTSAYATLAPCVKDILPFSDCEKLNYSD